MGELRASEIIERTAVWLSRIGRGNGYGIHSPSAFAFVHDVICRQGNFEAYSRLHPLRPKRQADSPPERDDRLLFRLAHYHNPATALVVGRNAAQSLKYLKAGCGGCRFAYLPLGNREELAREAQKLGFIDLLYADDASAWPAVWDEAIGYASLRALFIVRGIHSSTDCLNAWRQKTADSRVSTAYDLHYFGIACFEQRITKENYTVRYV